MSNRRKPRYSQKWNPRHRGQGIPENRTLQPGETYLIIPALANDRHEPGIEADLRQMTHDALYEHARDKELVTGIWWTIHYGAEALSRYQMALTECGQEPITQEEADEKGIQLEGNPSLLLVIAWAIGRAG